MTLSDALKNGRNNNLNLLRALAATLVIWAHAWGPTGWEPFHSVFKVGTGDVGVDVFFFLSGLLVAKSFCSHGFLEFAFARAKRIYPALWVSTTILVLVVGLFFSPLGPEFWKLPSTITYAIKNFFVLPGIGAQTDLPMAFNASTASFNTPLWTLPHEISMYALLGVVGLLGGMRKAWVPFAIMLVGIAGLIAAKFYGIELIGGPRSRFIALFFGGALCFVARDRIALNGWVALVLIALMGVVVFATANEVVCQVALRCVLPYVTLWLAFVPTWPRGYNLLGDYSYGLYILAFPVQMALFTGGVTGAWANFFATLTITLPLAALSWHGVEKRALNARLPRWLRFSMAARP
jgi:peptidoglycan/LPS O-acetylase OafA/YrhL